MKILSNSYTLFLTVFTILWIIYPSQASQIVIDDFEDTGSQAHLFLDSDHNNPWDQDTGLNQNHVIGGSRYAELLSGDVNPLDYAYANILGGLDGYASAGTSNPFTSNTEIEFNLYYGAFTIYGEPKLNSDWSNMTKIVYSFKTAPSHDLYGYIELMQDGTFYNANVSFSIPAGVASYSILLSSFNEEPGFTWKDIDAIDISFKMQMPDTPQSFALDSIVVIPEPASLMFLIIGSLMLQIDKR